MKLLALLLSAMCGLAGAAPAAAAFPEKPITLVVPFPPGGSTDVHLRSLANMASKELNQPVIIENRPGASGSVALTSIRSAAPDGYRLTVLVPTSLRLPVLQPMGYDPLKDFTYISMLSRYTYVIAVPAKSPFKSWADVLAYARANPGKLNYGNAGAYSSTHLTMEAIAAKEGIRWNAIPYKGDGDQVQDLTGSQLDLATPSVGGIGPMVDAGKVRLLAVMSGKRTQRYPDVPTLPEAGTDVVADVPYGIVGPAGMDPKVVAVLSQALRKASMQEDNLKLLVQLGQEDAYSTPEAFDSWARTTYVKERAQIEKMAQTRGDKP